MVPNGWEWMNLGKLANKVGSGVTPKGGSNSYKSSGIPLIRSQNVLWGTLDLKDVAFIDDSQHEKMKGSIVCKGDVLLNITGASIGRAAVSNLDEANVNQHVCIIRSDKLDPEFLRDFLLSFNGQKQIEQFQAGGNRQGLNFEQIKSFKLPLPPLQEQCKIAKILSTWDKAISTTERQIDNSKQQKKALMQQLLTGKKRLLDDSGKPFDGKWVEIIVGKAAELTAGATPSTKNSKYWGGNIPWMNSGEINLKQVFSVEGRITEIGLQKSSTKLIPENSILIALAGQGKTRGTVAINRVKLCTNQSIAAIMPNAKQLNSEFLYFNLDNRYRELRSMSTGDGGRGGLNLSILKSIKLHLPSLTEQQNIASVLTNADREIELLEQQLTDLKQEKKALMQQLLTGKRRVKLDDKEVA